MLLKDDKLTARIDCSDLSSTKQLEGRHLIVYWRYRYTLGVKGSSR